jgi:hypothetical protein
MCADEGGQGADQDTCGTQIPEEEQQKYEKGQHLRGRDAEIANQVCRDGEISVVIRGSWSNATVLNSVWCTLHKVSKGAIPRQKSSFGIELIWVQSQMSAFKEQLLGVGKCS